MYITPNSTVKLLKDVPLDASEDHTIYFTSKTQQRNWFDGYVKPGMVFEKQYYQRHSKESIKLEILADNIFDCNYIMFRNTSYGTKWFYGYITNIEYVNNNVSLITYIIDDLQTWYFDYTLGESFVIREHSTTDTIGGNIVPENIDIGELCVADEENLLYLNFTSSGAISGWTWCIVVVAPFDKTGASATGDEATNLYSGCKYNIFYSETDLANFFAQPTVAAKADQIVNIFYGIAEFIVQDTTASTPAPASSPKRYSNTVTKHIHGKFKNNYAIATASSDNDNQYTPKNNKLYTFPYNFLRVTDNKGCAKDYAYEYFPVDIAPTFEMTGDLSPTPSIIAAPVGYKYNSTTVDSTAQNWDEAIVLDNFPQCTWNSDAFIAWLAQTGLRLGGLMLGNAITAWGEYGSPFKAIDDTISGSVGGILASGGLAYLHGKDTRGRMQNTLNVAMNRFGLFAQNMRIRADYARIIDEYFTMFGYATNRVKVPNTHARESFTYTKTANCVLKRSEMPADAAKHICEIFNRGITFWDKNKTVGDYSQSNGVLT